MKQVHSIVWKEDKLYVAKALEVEVASQGGTEKKALANLQEALELYFEDNSEPNITPIQEPRLQNLSIHMNA